MKRWDVAVIGGGAAGLMAARTAARCGAETVLLEGNPRPGKKLLSTGNGRCNLTNRAIGPEHYRGDDQKIAAVLDSFPADRVIRAFEAIGLLCRADGKGRVYPNSLQAASVLRALWSACEEAGVEICADFPVDAVAPEPDGFRITGGQGACLRAERVILACGGKAAPKLSCKAGGYGLARLLGHSVTALSPALAPLKSPSKVCGALKGVRCRAKASLLCKGEEIYSESGEVIFGEGQLSGICIFNLSARLRAAKGGPLAVSLDLLESLDACAVAEYLQNLRLARPALPAGELFAGALPVRMGQEVAKAAGLPREKTIARLTESELARAVETVKHFEFPITGPAGWEAAQVTAGGVPLREIDETTMASLRCPGLYLAGELLDVDGDCGGYNLHWAWATGLLAGEAAGRGGKA